MLQLFQEFITPQQKELAAKVERIGENTLLESEQAMKELAGLGIALMANTG